MLRRSYFICKRRSTNCFWCWWWWRWFQVCISAWWCSCVRYLSSWRLSYLTFIIGLLTCTRCRTWYVVIYQRISIYSTYLLHLFPKHSDRFSCRLIPVAYSEIQYEKGQGTFQVYIFRSVQNLALNFFTLNFWYKKIFHLQRRPGARDLLTTPSVADLEGAEPAPDPLLATDRRRRCTLDKWQRYCLMATCSSEYSKWLLPVAFSQL